MSKVNFSIGDLVRGNNSNGYSITNSQSICEVKYLYESNDHMIVKVIKAPKDYEGFVGQEYKVDKNLFESVKGKFEVGDIIAGLPSSDEPYKKTTSQMTAGEVISFDEYNDEYLVKILEHTGLSPDGEELYESPVGEEYPVSSEFFTLVKSVKDRDDEEDEDTCNEDCEHCHKYDDDEEEDYDDEEDWDDFEDEEDWDDLNILQLVEVGDHVRGISDDYYVTSTEMTDGLVTYVDKEAKLIRVRVIAHRRNDSIGREFLVEQRDFEVIAPKISVGDYLVPTIRAEEAYGITGKDMILAKVTEIRKSTIFIKVLAHKYKYHNGFEDFVDPRYFKKIATSSPIVQGVSGYVTDSEEGVEDILVLHIGDVTLALPSDLMGIFNVGIAVKSPDDEANQELGDILAISRMKDPIRIPNEKIKTEEEEA